MKLALPPLTTTLVMCPSTTGDLIQKPVKYPRIFLCKRSQVKSGFAISVCLCVGSPFRATLEPHGSEGKGCQIGSKKQQFGPFPSGQCRRVLTPVFRFQNTGERLLLYTGAQHFPSNLYPYPDHNHQHRPMSIHAHPEPMGMGRHGHGYGHPM
jgi:hypothetical protein